MQITTARLLLGLSAIKTGLDQIERGQVDAGKRVAQYGVEFLNQLITADADDDAALEAGSAP